MSVQQTPNLSESASADLAQIAANSFARPLSRIDASLAEEWFSRRAYSALDF
jgi:hypothetical protein